MSQIDDHMPVGNEYRVCLTWFNTEYWFTIQFPPSSGGGIQPGDGVEVGSNIDLHSISIPHPIIESLDLTELTCVVESIQDDGTLQVIPISAYYPHNVIQHMRGSHERA